MRQDIRNVDCVLQAKGTTFKGTKFKGTKSHVSAMESPWTGLQAAVLACSLDGDMAGAAVKIR